MAVAAGSPTWADRDPEASSLASLSGIIVHVSGEEGTYMEDRAPLSLMDTRAGATLSPLKRVPYSYKSIKGSGMRLPGGVIPGRQEEYDQEQKEIRALKARRKEAKAEAAARRGSTGLTLMEKMALKKTSRETSTAGTRHATPPAPNAKELRARGSSPPPSPPKPTVGPRTPTRSPTRSQASPTSKPLGGNTTAVSTTPSARPAKTPKTEETKKGQKGAVGAVGGGESRGLSSDLREEDRQAMRHRNVFASALVGLSPTPINDTSSATSSALLDAPKSEVPCCEGVTAWGGQGALAVVDYR